MHLGILALDLIEHILAELGALGLLHVDAGDDFSVWRKQIQDQLKVNSGKASVAKALVDMDQRIWSVESKLVSRSEVLSDDKYFPEAYKVYMNLIWLSGGVGQGASDEAGSIDYRPTETQMQVLELIEKDLASAKSAFEKLSTTDLPAFNKSMAGKVAAIGGA